MAGTQHVADTIASAAMDALLTAYTSGTALNWTSQITGDLGGRTLEAGVYNSTGGLSITGALTLHGNATAIFIFHMATTLILSSGATIMLTGGTQPCNVQWLVRGNRAHCATRWAQGNSAPAVHAMNAVSQPLLPIPLCYAHVGWLISDTRVYRVSLWYNHRVCIHLARYRRDGKRPADGSHGRRHAHRQHRHAPVALLHLLCCQYRNCTPRDCR